MLHQYFKKTNLLPRRIKGYFTSIFSCALNEALRPNSAVWGKQHGKQHPSPILSETSNSRTDGQHNPLQTANTYTISWVSPINLLGLLPLVGCWLFRNLPPLSIKQTLVWWIWSQKAALNLVAYRSCFSSSVCPVDMGSYHLPRKSDILFKSEWKSILSVKSVRKV